MRVCLMMGFALVQFGAAAAQTAECDKIKYTNVPIEITAKGAAMNRLSSGVLATDSPINIPPNQIYRDEFGSAVALSRTGPQKSYAKTDLLFGFVQKHVIDLESGDKVTEYRYDPPIKGELRTNRADFGLDATRETTQNGETTTETIHATYNYISSGTVVIGACSYEVENFEINSGVFKGDQLVSSTNWKMAYSVPLKASLSNEILNFDANRVLLSIVRYNAKTVTTDFVPIKE